MLYLRVLIVCCISQMLVTGCANHYGKMPIQDDRGSYNLWTIDTVFDNNVRSAIIKQRTIYPYHFVHDSSELNELGRRDVEVLAAHLARHGGEVSIRQGHEAESLTQARTATVMIELSSAGVDPETIRLINEFPRGDGMGADAVIHILERARTSPRLSPTPVGIDIGGGQ